jgi:2-keto-4-pentenoate hydratase
MEKLYTLGMSMQLDAMRARMASGMPRRGWKIGINVPEVQRALGLQHALVGWLDGDRILRSGSRIVCDAGTQLHAEPELCLRLRASVEANTDLDSARKAVAAVAPAIEIVDYAKAKGSLTDIVGHSMFHAACVVGDWQSVPERGDIDIAARVQFRAGIRQSAAARVDLVPSQVGEIVLLCASVLAEANERLLAGDWILSGSFTALALALNLNEEVCADFAELGQVTCVAC